MVGAYRFEIGQSARQTASRPRAPRNLSGSTVVPAKLGKVLALGREQRPSRKSVRTPTAARIILKSDGLAVPSDWKSPSGCLILHSLAAFQRSDGTSQRKAASLLNSKASLRRARESCRQCQTDEGLSPQYRDGRRSKKRLGEESTLAGFSPVSMSSKFRCLEFRAHGC
jgi:hypothetical protein